MLAYSLYLLYRLYRNSIQTVSAILRKATMNTEKRYINLYLDAATLERIDKYRYDNRFPTRTEAIRHLIEKALPPNKAPSSKRT